MNDLSHLSPHLRTASQSHDEIVLDFLDANEALTYLTNSSFAVSSVECRIIRQDGTRGDAPEYAASTGPLPRAEEATSIYAKRANAFARQLIRERHDRFLEDEAVKGSRLFFCLTVSV